MTASNPDLDQYTKQIGEAVGKAAPLNATIKFAFNEGGVIYIDGKANPGTVDNEDRPAQCTVKVGLEDFSKMMQRKLDPTTAFMTGKIKIEGDMGIAMKLGRVFG
jgi:putative sterol carrier protein